jgi:hypothetical protein
VISFGFFLSSYATFIGLLANIVFFIWTKNTHLITLCQIYAQDTSKLVHMIRDKHDLKMNRIYQYTCIHIRAILMAEKNFCEFCKVKFTSQSKYKIHIGTKKHENAVKKSIIQQDETDMDTHNTNIEGKRDEQIEKLKEQIRKLSDKRRSDNIKSKETILKLEKRCEKYKSKYDQKNNEFEKQRELLAKQIVNNTPEVRIPKTDKNYSRFIDIRHEKEKEMNKPQHEYNPIDKAWLNVPIEQAISELDGTNELIKHNVPSKNDHDTDEESNGTKSNEYEFAESDEYDDKNTNDTIKKPK